MTTESERLQEKISKLPLPRPMTEEEKEKYKNFDLSKLPHSSLYYSQDLIESLKETELPTEVSTRKPK